MVEHKSEALLNGEGGGRALISYIMHGPQCLLCFSFSFCFVFFRPPERNECRRAGRADIRVAQCVIPLPVICRQGLSCDSSLRRSLFSCRLGIEPTFSQVSCHCLQDFVVRRSRFSGAFIELHGCSRRQSLWVQLTDQKKMTENDGHAAGSSGNSDC